MVELPILPVEYGDQSGEWQIEWWDGSTIRRRRATLDSTTVTLEGTESGAALVVVALTPTLQPGPGLSVPLAPYGAWGAPGDRACFPRRSRGELAMVMLRLADRGLEPALLNVERLDSLVLIRCGIDGTRYLDQERLLQALGAGEMRSFDVDTVDTLLWEFRREGEVAQIWLSDEPTAPTLTLTPAAGYVAGAIVLMPGELRQFWRVEDAAGMAAIAHLVVAADESDHVTAVLTHHVIDELVRDRNYLDDLLALE